MYRVFFIALLIPLMPLHAQESGAAPATSVWVEPAHAVPGADIELSAFVYNKTAKTATATVSFTNNQKEVSTTTITIAPQTGKVAVGAWQEPEAPTIITATVTKAEDASKKPIPELVGVIGSVTVGADTKLISTDKIQSSVTQWFASVFAAVEPWRKKEAAYFMQLRDSKKDELGINRPRDILDDVKDITTPETPAKEGDQQREPTLSDLQLQKNRLPIMNYVVLLYATAFATIFSSMVMFYITGFLLVVLVIRFFFNLFR